jgi:hypothetical protein
MIINQQYRCIFARFSQDRSVVKLGMTRDFDSRIVGSSPAAPVVRAMTGSKSMVDGWFWEPAAGGSNPLSPINTLPFGYGGSNPSLPIVMFYYMGR